jgi:riboflavin kinase/FMN adenylyltransferase
VGTNPTFGSEPLHVESFLLDYEGDDLPGEPLSIEFWARLRDEIRYDSVEELVSAIAADVDRTVGLVPGDALA